MECIFKNDTFQYINGIPKSELESIYRSGDVGKQSVYDIISKTSSEVVGTTSNRDAQAELLKNSFAENGKLNSNSSEFSVSKCYDADGNLVGIELESSKSGVLIECPADTVSSEKIVQADKKTSIEETSDLDTKKEVGDLESKQEVKEESGDSEGKQEVKEETCDSEAKQEVKEETGDSENKQEVKEETGDSETKQEVKEEAGDSESNQ